MTKETRIAMVAVALGFLAVLLLLFFMAQTDPSPIENEEAAAPVELATEQVRAPINEAELATGPIEHHSPAPVVSSAPIQGQVRRDQTPQASLAPSELIRIVVDDSARLEGQDVQGLLQGKVLLDDKVVDQPSKD